MALSHSLLSDSESIDEMAHLGDLFLATQARLQEQTALAARLEERYTILQERYTSLQERYTALQERYTTPQERYTAPQERYTALQERYTAERYRTVIFFAMIIIAYFIWLVYFLLFTKLGSYTN